MKILIAGDFCPQQRVAKLFNHDDFSTVLGDVKPIIEEADYSIVNFECAVTHGGEKPIDKIGPNLQCSKRGVEAVKWVGFDCVTLANNHFYDFGEDGVANTLNACQEYGIDTVGGGLDLHEASKILYKEINEQTLAIINCCEHEFSIATDKTGGSNPLNPIHQYYAIKEAREKADFVLVIVHGGHEMYQLPSPRMQEIYRFFIEAGADAVVNHHQHCFSGYEYYNGKPIFYGLGNFLFDWEGKRNNIWNEGYLVELSFLKGLKPMFSLFPYVQCNETPCAFPFATEEKRIFHKKIEDLNSIISSPNLLETNYSKLLNCYAKEYKLLFEPYNNRIMKGLYRKRLLPSFLNHAKMAKLYNYLSCESHLECVIHSLCKHK